MDPAAADGITAEENEVDREVAILSVVLLPTVGEAGGGRSGCSSVDPVAADGIKAEKNEADGEVVGGGELQGRVAASWPTRGESG